MKRIYRKPIFLGTGLAWLLAVVIYASLYVRSRLLLPDLQGYEADWSWQLLFFGLTRLPWLVGLLVLTLLAEHVLLRQPPGD